MSDQKAQLREQIKSLKSSLETRKAGTNSWTNPSYVNSSSTGKGAPRGKGGKGGKGKGGKGGGKGGKAAMNKTYRQPSQPKGKGGKSLGGNKTYVRQDGAKNSASQVDGALKPVASLDKSTKTTKGKGGHCSAKGGKGSHNKVYVRSSTSADSTSKHPAASHTHKTGRWDNWKSWSSGNRKTQPLLSSRAHADSSTKKISAPQAAHRMFLKLLAQRRSKTRGGFSKSSHGNQLVRVSSAVEEARKAGIQKAGKQSLQWVRHEVLSAHAENVKVHAENVKSRSEKKQKRVVNVGGEMYQRSKGGQTLVRVPEPAADSTVPAQKPEAANSTKRTAHPSRTIIGGSTYISKGSAMVRVTAKTSALKARSTRRSLALLRTKSKSKKTTKGKQLCIFFIKFGKCSKLPDCPYLHDKSKVAVCPKFLRGLCDDAECPLSHVVSADKMPVCRHFLSGLCNNDACPYLHVKVSDKASVCKDFLKGFCPRGTQCRNKHVLVCQAFLRGQCSKGTACDLHHPKENKLRSKKSKVGNKRKLPSDGRSGAGHAPKRIKPELAAGLPQPAVPEPVVS